MNWIVEEMSEINLGDKRLNDRTINLFEKLSRDPIASIPTANQSWPETKAAYRFFDNDKVTQEKILQPHIQSSLKRIQKQKRVLLLQDTTELNYTGQQKKHDVGPSHHEDEKIIFFHPLLAVTPEKRALGVIDIHSWHREELLRKKYSAKESNTRRLHRQHISEKESYRWLLGYQKASRVAEQCPDTHIVMIADREADIADIYHEAEQCQTRKADWLIRAAKRNRVLLTQEGKRVHLLLNDKLLSTEPVGHMEFMLSSRSGEPTRKVNQTVRALRVKLHPPTGRRGQLRLKPSWVTAILATEETPPEGVEPVEWLLMTNIELNESIQFQDIFQWYLCRWQIEIFFYVLKSGCHVEKLQLEKASRFLPCLAMYSIIAWRILMMTQASRDQGELSCESLFEKIEWQTVYAAVKKQKPPPDPPSLSTIVRYLAQLGGFLARKGDGPPGPKTIWRGLQMLKNYIILFETCNQYQSDTYG